MASPLGSRIREAREAAGLSREVLAVRAGIAASTLMRIENHGDSPRLSTLEAIAGVLGVELSTLLAAA